MGFAIIDRNYTRYGARGECILAVLDSADDLADLGTGYAPGSIAMVADKDGPVYMMNASGAWKEQ